MIDGLYRAYIFPDKDVVATQNSINKLLRRDSFCEISKECIIFYSGGIPGPFYIFEADWHIDGIGRVEIRIPVKLFRVSDYAPL